MLFNIIKLKTYNNNNYNYKVLFFNYHKLIKVIKKLLAVMGIMVKELVMDNRFKKRIYLDDDNDYDHLLYNYFFFH